MPVGYTPIFRIEQGGVDITDRFNTQTTEIQVELHSGGGSNDTFKITLDDRGWKLIKPDVGGLLQIHLGYKEVGLSFVGLFEINEVVLHGPPRAMTLTGLSAGMTGMLKSPAIKDFEQRTVGEILQEIGGKAGLSVQVDAALAAHTIPFKNQIGTSGFHLIHELERQFGAVAKVWNGQLIFTPRDAGTDVTGSPMSRRVLRPEHFGTWSVKHSTRSEYSSVKVPYFDKVTNTTKWVEEIWEGLNPNTFGGADTPFRVNRKFNTKEEAEAFAKSRLAALKRSTGEAEIALAKGDPWIMPQMPVFVSGMRDGINGAYVVDVVSHYYSKESGIQTKMVCRNPSTDYGTSFMDELTDDKLLAPAPGEVIDYLTGRPLNRGML